MTNERGLLVRRQTTAGGRRERLPDTSLDLPAGLLRLELRAETLPGIGAGAEFLLRLGDGLLLGSSGLDTTTTCGQSQERNQHDQATHDVNSGAMRATPPSVSWTLPQAFERCPGCLVRGTASGTRLDGDWRIRGGERVATRRSPRARDGDPGRFHSAWPGSSRRASRRARGAPRQAGPRCAVR